MTVRGLEPRPPVSIGTHFNLFHFDWFCSKLTHNLTGWHRFFEMCSSGVRPHSAQCWWRPTYASTSFKLCQSGIRRSLQKCSKKWPWEAHNPSTNWIQQDLDVYWYAWGVRNNLRFIVRLLHKFWITLSQKFLKICEAISKEATKWGQKQLI